MIRGISQRIRLDAVILFGSRARGDATLQSDYDIVVIGDFHEQFLDRLEWVLDYTPHVPTDVFCYTPAEFEKMFSTYRLTAIDAVGEGIVLFGGAFIRPFKARYADFVRRGLHKTTCTLVPPSN